MGWRRWNFLGDATDLERSFPIVQGFWIDRSLQTSVQSALGDGGNSR